MTPALTGRAVVDTLLSDLIALLRGGFYHTSEEDDVAGFLLPDLERAPDLIDRMDDARRRLALGEPMCPDGITAALDEAARGLCQHCRAGLPYAARDRVAFYSHVRPDGSTVACAARPVRAVMLRRGLVEVPR